MTLKNELMVKLNALPRPVTADAVKECAKQVVSGKDLQSFNQWMEKNGAHLVGRLNA